VYSLVDPEAFTREVSSGYLPSVAPIVWFFSLPLRFIGVCVESILVLLRTVLMFTGPRSRPSRMIGRTDMKTSPNQTVEPTGAPRWDFHAPGESKIPGFGGRQARAPVAHFSRSPERRAFHL
jgi:hypothetical protein